MEATKPYNDDQKHENLSAAGEMFLTNTSLEEKEVLMIDDCNQTPT